MAHSIVLSATQKLGNWLLTEGQNLYEVRYKVENLQNDLILMEAYLQDAENREHGEAHVRQWVADIREIAYDAEDIIERYVHEVSHHRESGIYNTLKWLCCLMFDACPLHEVGSNIDRLRARIEELATQAKMYRISQSESSTQSAMLREQRRTYAHIKEHVVGFQEEEKEVVDILLDKKPDTKPQFLVICGMGGLGKTTLTRKVYSNNSIEQHFKSCAWVHVSQNVDKRKVFEEILSQLGDQDTRRTIKELTDQQFPAKICEVLKKKICLVVLDDIWNICDWQLLKPAFQLTETSRSKILLTTRYNDVLNGAEYNVHLCPLRALNEGEAWTLLQREAFPNGGEHIVEPWMKELGKEMLKRCDGHPLAILALGGVLATKRTTEDQWKDVQRRITSYLIREADKGRGRSLSSVLDLSFYELPFYLKPCFLYLGSFPEGYKISAERLYLLWEAEGILSTAIYRNQGMSCLEIAEIYLNELVKRNMVQVEERWLNGSIKSCRLHEVMRDACVKKCKEVNYLNVVEPRDLHNPSSRIASSFVGSKRIHRSAIHWWQNPERQHNVDNVFFHYLQSNARFLRSLLAFSFEAMENDGTKFCSSKVKEFSLLRVLDLEGCIKYNILKVIGGPIHLRYLSLKGLYFSDLPSCICDVKYLETLVLESGDNVVMLLPNMFRKMERLKHLYLPKKFRIEGSDEKLIIGISNHQSSQMETLENFDPNKFEMDGLLRRTNLKIFSFNEDYILEANDVWKGFLQPLMKSGQLMSCLKLRICATIINEDPKTFTSAKVPEYVISSLEINGTIGKEFPHFPRGLLRLKLDVCEISAACILELEKLPFLKELVLVNNAVRGKQIITSADGFPQLIALQVEYLDALEEWKLLGTEALPKLRDLNVKGCPKWDGWPEGGDLPKLRNVSIVDSGQNKHAPEGSSSSN